MVAFNFSYAPGTSVQQMTGFEIAGRTWSSYLTDNTTLNLYVGVSSSLPGNVIGGALPGMRGSQSYNSVKALLQADATSIDDQTSTRSLSFGSDFEAHYDVYDLLGLVNTGKTVANTTLNLSRANAKAIGMNLADGATALDGYIIFGGLAGSSVTWNYDYTRSSTPAANSLDFLSTAIHEIGHVLGFASGVDKPGWLSSTPKTLSDLLSYTGSLDQRIDNTTTLDLFRYSSLSTRANDSDLSYGSKAGSKYFSVDGGKTAIAQFSTGADTSLYGDGYEASHWKAQTNPIGIMAPTLSTGQRSTISAADLRALDVIGWNLSSTGINTKIDLSALQSQSKQALASRLNQTVSWLDTNATTAAQSLAQNRDLDVYTMILNSQTYDLSKTTTASTATVYKLVIQSVLYQEALFETLDEMTVLDPAADVSQSSLVNTNTLSKQIQDQVASNSLQRWAVDFSQPMTAKVSGHGVSVHQGNDPSGFVSLNVNDQILLSVGITKTKAPALSSVLPSSSAHSNSTVANVKGDARFLGSSNTGFWRDYQSFSSSTNDRGYNSPATLRNSDYSEYRDALLDSLNFLV